MALLATVAGSALPMRLLPQGSDAVLILHISGKKNPRGEGPVIVTTALVWLGHVGFNRRDDLLNHRCTDFHRFRLRTTMAIFRPLRFC